MWTYLLGPLLALLPRRRRESAFSAYRINWSLAGFLSGAAESLLALFALIYWYSYSVSGWAQQALFSTIKAHPEAAIQENAVGFAALTLVALHPFTWLIAFFAFEGVVRLLDAAFTGDVLGSFPLYVLDRFIPSRERSPAENQPPQAAPIAQIPASSFLDAMRLKFASALSPIVPDEIFSSIDGSGEVLEIRSCRPKDRWDPPQVVRYQKLYYRLESSSTGSAPRPYRFHLRRLAAGVPSRTVLEYSPEGTPILIDH
jgi:hypothetical protein